MSRYYKILTPMTHAASGTHVHFRSPVEICPWSIPTRARLLIRASVLCSTIHAVRWPHEDLSLTLDALLTIHRPVARKPPLCLFELPLGLRKVQGSINLNTTVCPLIPKENCPIRHRRGLITNILNVPALAW